MAYDSSSDRVIMFGGYNRTGGVHNHNDTWAYDFNTNTWTNMTRPGGPPPTFNPVMAYDSESDRVIMLGDEPPTRDVVQRATWAYDFETNTWADMTQPGEPPRWLGAVAYDSLSDRVILFGAHDSLTNLGATWAYDFNTNTWTSMAAPARDPGARFEHALAYDSESDRVILFGGLTFAVVLNDTWAYDFETNTWVDVTSRPISRPSNLVAYDAESDRVVLVAGEAHSPYFRTNSDTWTYDFNTNTWTKVHALGPDIGPPIGYAFEGNPAADMTYDSESDRLILFGLRAGTWAYDSNSNTWMNMTRSGGPPNVFGFPPNVVGSRITYDAQSDRVVLFAGGPAVETWAYDFNTNTWTNMTRPGGPPNVFGSRMAYDSQSDRVVLFGGFYEDPFGESPCSGETWAYDFETNTWTNMTRPSGASERGFATMAYDVDHDRMILYGGACYVEGRWEIRHDTWAYDFDTNTWTDLAPSANPGLQRSPAMAFDTESHVSILLGRQVWRPEVPFEFRLHAGPWWYRLPEAAPTSPRSLRAVEGNRQVTLHWAAPDYDGGRPLSGYRIYRFAWPEGLSVVATVGPVFTYTDTGLTNGVLYYYWVSALNAIGEGTLSHTASATPRLTLTAPSNLHVSTRGREVLLDWEPATSGADSPITGYRIYRGTSVDHLSVIATVPNQLGYGDTDVAFGIMYYYRVSALSGSDEGPRSASLAAMLRETLKPNVVIQSPTDRQTLAAGRVTILGVADDDTAIARVELSLDGTNWIAASGTTSWSGSLQLVEGANTIYARATDTSGNTETVRVSVTVLNPIVSALSSPIVIAAVVVAGALVVGAVLLRRLRDGRWEQR